MGSGVEICRGFTTEDWTVLRDRLNSQDEAAWNTAVEVFDRRIRERYLNSIQSLINADTIPDTSSAKPWRASGSSSPTDTDAVVPGFAIVALCCLLIETLQSFRASPVPLAPGGECGFPHSDCVRSGSSTTAHFVAYLRRPSFRGEFDEERTARRFVEGVRNGIFHNAETRKWMIRRNRPRGRIVAGEEDRLVLNRTEFYKSLKSEYDMYIDELRNSNDPALRDRFLEEMDDLVRQS